MHAIHSPRIAAGPETRNTRRILRIARGDDKPLHHSVDEIFRRSWKRTLRNQLFAKTGELPFPESAKSFEDAFDLKFPKGHSITPEEFNDWLIRMKLAPWRWNDSSFGRSLRLDTLPTPRIDEART